MELVEGVFAAPAEFVERAHVDAATYETLYAQSLNDPAAFWGEQGQRIDWIKTYTRSNCLPCHLTAAWRN